jgi:hypothetical protein
VTIRFFLPLLVLCVLPLWADTKLNLANIRHREYQDGPIISGNPEYLAGATVFLDFQISGYQIAEKALVRSMSLTWKWRFLDPSGRDLVLGAAGEIEHELQPEDKDWMPKVRLELPLSPSAPTGKCRILIELEDRKAGTRGQREILIPVSGRTLPAASAPEILNLRFYRGEDEPEPLSTPAYRPGDAVWIRFDVIGFQLGPKNSAQLAFDLEVLNDKSEPVITAADAFELGSPEEFYPPRFLPGGLRIDLDKRNAPGTYRLRLRAKDRTASQSKDFEYTFTLE